MKRLPLLLLLFSLLLAGCDEIATVFTGPFPKRNVNLERKWGREMTILTDGDTVLLQVRFIREGRQNLITYGQDDDTLFMGDVSYYGGLYYLSRALNDSSYHIHAVEYYDDTMLGLGSEWIQMTKWTEALEEGQFRELVESLDTSTGGYRLKPNTKVMHSFYQSLVDSLPPAIVLKREGNKPPANSTDEEEPELSIDTSNPLSLFPNPASEYVNVKINGQVIDRLEVYEVASGRLVYNDDPKIDRPRIDLKGLSAGMYSVKAITKDGTQYFQQLQVVR